MEGKGKGIVVEGKAEGKGKGKGFVVKGRVGRDERRA